MNLPRKIISYTLASIVTIASLTVGAVPTYASEVVKGLGNIPAYDFIIDDLNNFHI